MLPSSSAKFSGSNMSIVASGDTIPLVVPESLDICFDILNEPGLQSILDDFSDLDDESYFDVMKLEMLMSSLLEPTSSLCSIPSYLHAPYTASRLHTQCLKEFDSSNMEWEASRRLPPHELA